MTASEIINKYIAFFENKGHKRIPNAPLVPQNDPTTLFTSSGMQPLVPYLLGEEHPMGKKIVNVQNCFRAEDIDEVGDNRHTTFFRMLGNWSLGDYFKEEQLSWFFEFLTDKKECLGLDPKRLYATAFKGNDQIPPDKESIGIWQALFKEKGINAKLNERIFLYDVGKNWWSRSGTPDKMPVGEPGGPDSEVFYEFAGVEHDKKYGPNCHPNCNCGRFMEIGNSVFMQYKKTEKGFEELPRRNVDFGAGVERLLAAVENKQDIFETSLFNDLRTKLSESIKKSKSLQSLNEAYRSHVRIFLDHSQATVFLISEGIYPGNKEQESVLRRLIRKADDQLILTGLDDKFFWQETIDHFTQVNKNNYDKPFNKNTILQVVLEEIKKYEGVRSYANTQAIKSSIFPDDDNNKPTLTYNLERYNMGTADPITFMNNNSFKSLASVTAGSVAFDAQATRGYPVEETMSIATVKLGNILDPEEAKRTFELFKDQHRKVSGKSAEKKFKGGLADTSAKTIRGHTATHLLHQALRDVLGNHVFQTGSNITSERVRFDFNSERALTPNELKKVESIVNEKIKEDLPVHFEILPLKKAKEIGAIGLFDDKYAETVKIYFIGNNKPYSIEFCGGPHVETTSKVGKFSIIKQENIGSGKRRIYSKVD